MAIPRWKWLEKVGASEEAEKEKAKPIPKPTVIEKTVSKTTTARRRRLEHTQEFEDVGRSSVSEPMPEPTVISDRHKQTDVGKLAFIRSITGHGKENIPEKIRDLGPSAEKEYAVTAYKTQRGIISYERGIERMQSGFETRLREGSLPTSLRWMKEHGTFTSDGKAYTWSELKEKHPRLEMKRESGEFIIYEKPFDYTAWREEQYKDMDPFSASVRRGAATFLEGFANWDYIYASQTGDPTDITKQQSKLGAIIDKWEYDTTHNIESSGISPFRYFSEQHHASLAIVDTKFPSIFGAVVGTIGNIPAVTNILAPYGMGVGIGAVYKGIYDASALLASKGLEHTGKVLERGAKGIGIGIGAIAVGTAGLDVYATYQQDQEKALTKALTYGTQFFSLGRGFKAVSDISSKPVDIKQPGPDVTFKGQYNYGINLVGRGRPYSNARIAHRTLVGRGRPYTPMKGVVYIPTSPGVVAGKARFHYERYFDSGSFLYKKPSIAKDVDPYSLKGLNEWFGQGKTTKGILDREPFFEITKPSGSTIVSRPSGIDTFSPISSGKNVLLAKIKTITIPTETITISVPSTTGKTTFGKMPMMGFSEIKGGGILGKIWGRRLSIEMLASSESGIYTGVHSYWFGVIPILKTALKPMTITIPKYGFDILQLPQYTSLLDNITSIQTEEVGQISRQTPSFLTDTMIKTDTISATKNILDIKSINETIQKSIAKTITKTITRTVPDPISVVSPSYYYPLSLPSSYTPSGHYKKKKKWLEIEGARKRVHPVTLLKIPKIPFQEVNI